MHEHERFMQRFFDEVWGKGFINPDTFVTLVYSTL